ncbi:MAG: hypothetical protein WC683_14855 [bacterium]
MSSTREDFPIGWVRRNGEWEKLPLPLSTVLRHWLLTGTTGWGKSALLHAITLMLLTRTPEIGVVWLDQHGDGADDLVERFLPSLLERCPQLEPSRIVVIRPFGRYSVKLSPLHPIPHVLAEVQAHIVATLLADLTDGNWGGRMTSIITALCLAGISAGGSLLDVLRLVQEPSYAATFAAKVPLAESRNYLVNILPEEPQAAKDAVRARLEWLLLIPPVRATLCADSSISGADLLEAPLSVVSLGGCPQGFLPLARFMGSLLLSRIVGAIFARPPGAHHVAVFCDEWQELVRGGGAPDLERCLAQARHHGVNLVLANQTLAQVSEVSPTLVRSLMANISVHIAFRPGAEDIKHLVPLLPITGRKIDPEHPDKLLTPEAERRELLERLGRLPPRHALLGDFVSGRAEIVRTLDVPYEEARKRACRMSDQDREEFRQGQFGVPVQQLVAACPSLTCSPRSDGDEEYTSPLSPTPRKSARRGRSSRPPLVLP